MKPIEAESLFETLEAGFYLLTPNRRLSADSLKRYADYQRAKSVMAYASPSILPLNVWQLQCYDNALLTLGAEKTPLLLNPLLAQSLWEQIVQSTQDTIHVLQPAKTAQLLQSAYGLLKQWNLTLDHPDLCITPEDEKVNAWMRTYENTCEKNKWLDAAGLSAWLWSVMSDWIKHCPRKIALFGFNDFTPMQQLFFRKLTEHGIDIINITLKQTEHRVHHTEFETELAEWEAAAVYARKITQADKQKRIAIVVPDLETKRESVIQTFKKVFTTSEFNISAGKRLADFPIISTALQCLELHHGNLGSDEMTALFLSPFLGDAERERAGRAEWDRRRRKNNVVKLHLKRLSSLQRSWFESDCAKLLKRLDAFFEIINNVKKQTLAQWAATFTQSLNSLGWPGERILNSEEYQIVQAWLRLLSELQSLDVILPPQSFADALHLLRTAAHQQVFQPQSDEANIQILGLLEASGLSFDVIWITALDNTAWPPAPKPNAFIPKRLQREHNMPHATAERELQYCKQMMVDFQKSAGELILSYAAMKEKTTREASSLIKHYPAWVCDDLALRSNTHPYKPQALEIFTDTLAPPIDNFKLQGGISLIKKQAECPFRAFAETRLDAEALHEPQVGLQATDRGNLLHSALESIWQRLQTHEALIQCTNNDLEALIQASIELAFNSITLPYAKESRYLKLERQRLANLLKKWLDVEKQRPAFKVLTHEKSVSVQLDTLSLDARIDRIDELTDGSQFIIDYKTGSRNDIKHWFDARPDQPQLPLYSLTNPAAITGIAYAEINAKNTVFKGLSDTELDIAGVKPLASLKFETRANTWPEQINVWRNTLTNLAKNYASGQATVDPKHRQICDHCDLGGFCRIKEKELMQ